MDTQEHWRQYMGQREGKTDQLEKATLYTPTGHGRVKIQALDQGKLRCNPLPNAYKLNDTQSLRPFQNLPTGG